MGEARRSWTQRLAVLLAAAALALSASPAAAAPGDGSGDGSGATPCEQMPAPTEIIAEPGWPQATYQAQTTMWPFATGAGISVAVLSTGVNAAHPQLAGKVLSGIDLVSGQGSATEDCGPLGTGVAAVIAGTKLSGIGSFGLAPDVSILPVRTTQAPQSDLSSNATLSPDVIAAGIDAARTRGAQVIVVPDIAFTGSPGLQQAVQSALSAGIVIVASVGDAHPSDSVAALEPTPADRTPYPAAYDGVIGVAAMGPDGHRLGTSAVGTYVDLLAPGVQVVSAGTDGHQVYGGSGIATGYAAAAAALLLSAPGSALGTLSGAALPQAVAAQLAATAGPASGYFGALGYGAGIVDPARALTEPAAAGGPVPAGAHEGPVQDPDAAAKAAFVDRAADRSALPVWAAVLAAAAFVLAARIARRGLPRRFRSLDYQPGPADRDKPLEYIAGERLFDVDIRDHRARRTDPPG